MPFLEDGTPVDVVLNPLGVPGRMNVGQVLETHLGWVAKQGWDISLAAGKVLSWRENVPEIAATSEPGRPVATPVFDGVHEDALTGLLSTTIPNRDGDRMVGADGTARLFDGRSGAPFPEAVSVGYMYLLKLHHLVDDMILARSTGR